jgi:hypothetical protein
MLSALNFHLLAGRGEDCSEIFKEKYSNSSGVGWLIGLQEQKRPMVGRGIEDPLTH